MTTTMELVREAGITYRQLDYWTRIGVLAPRNPACGSGSQRGWDENEVRTVMLLGKLRAAGLPLRTLRAVGEAARGWNEAAWAGVVFIQTDGTIDRRGQAISLRVDLDELGLQLQPA